MPHFVATYRYQPGPDAEARRAAVRPSHREYLDGLDALVLSGPTAGPAGAGALLVFEASSADVVEGLLDADPFTTAGVVAERSVAGWTVVSGRARDLLA